MASTSGDAATEEPAMTLEQFKEQLTELNKGLRSLPATAQVNPLAAAASYTLVAVAGACTADSLHADRVVPSVWHVPSPQGIQSSFHLCTWQKTSLLLQPKCLFPYFLNDALYHTHNHSW